MFVSLSLTTKRELSEYLRLSHPMGIKGRDPCYVSCFFNTSTEEEEEEPASGTTFSGNDRCILSKAKFSRSHLHSNSSRHLCVCNGNICDEQFSEQVCSGPSLNMSALFKNTNVEEVLNRQRQKRDQAREDAVKKKEMDKAQREKDKAAKQDRKEKEKKRTQKGERKR